LKDGNIIRHSLFPEDEFEITEIVKNEKDDIEMLVTKDKQEHIAFITDTNLRNPAGSCACCVCLTASNKLVLDSCVVWGTCVGFP